MVCEADASFGCYTSFCNASLFGFYASSPGNQSIRFYLNPVIIPKRQAISREDDFFVVIADESQRPHLPREGRLGSHVGRRLYIGVLEHRLKQLAQKERTRRFCTRGAMRESFLILKKEATKINENGS